MANKIKTTKIRKYLEQILSSKWWMKIIHWVNTLTLQKVYVYEVIVQLKASSFQMQKIG